MAKESNNTWLISMTIIAIVAIVAVFGLVKMTGYAIYGGFGTYSADNNIMMNYGLNGHVMMLKAQALANLKQSGYNDVNVLWVTFTYKNIAVIGAKVYNTADGTINGAATNTIGGFLTTAAANDNDIYALTGAPLDSAISIVAQPLGTGPGSSLQ